MPSLRFDVSGDAAMACYFLMANWPKDGAGPTLDTTSNPVVLVFEAQAKVIDGIRAQLQKAEGIGGNMAKSARAVALSLEKKAKELHVDRDGGSSKTA